MNRESLPFKNVFDDIVESKMTATPWLLQDIEDDLESISELDSEILISEKMVVNESIMRASIQALRLTKFKEDNQEEYDIESPDENEVNKEEAKDDKLKNKLDNLFNKMQLIKQNQEIKNL